MKIVHTFDVNHASKFRVEEQAEWLKRNIDQEISTDELHNTFDNLPRQTKYIDRYNDDLLLLEGNPRKKSQIEKIEEKKITPLPRGNYSWRNYED